MHGLIQLFPFVGLMLFARYIVVELSMTLRRVRTSKIIQDRPLRSRLGVAGIWGIPMDEFVNVMWGFKNYHFSMDNGFHIIT